MNHFIVFTCIMFIAGLSVGSVFFIGELQPNTTYPIEGRIVYAYFKVSNMSLDSGIGYEKILSYVIVANITNISDATLRITQARIDEINHIISYRSDFTDNEDYLFDPNSSRLIAFSKVSGLSGLSLEAFEGSNQLTTTLAVSFSPTEGKGHGGVLSKTSFTLRSISADEYVYSEVNQTSYYLFGDLPISAWSVTDQMK